MGQKIPVEVAALLLLRGEGTGAKGQGTTPPFPFGASPPAVC